MNTARMRNEELMKLYHKKYSWKTLVYLAYQKEGREAVFLFCYVFITLHMYRISSISSP